MLNNTCSIIQNIPFYFNELLNCMKNNLCKTSKLKLKTHVYSFLYLHSSCMYQMNGLKTTKQIQCQ